MAQVKISSGDLQLILERALSNGTPQKPKVVIDLFRRLGSGRQRIQKLGKQANVSQSRVKSFHASRQQAEDVVESMLQFIGERCSIDFGGYSAENVIMMDVTYQITGQQGDGITAMVEFQLEYMIDGEEEE